MQIVGFEEFERKMLQEIENYDIQKEKLMRRLGRIYSSEVKGKIKETGAVDTGRLRASIDIGEVTKNSVEVGTNVEYAEFVNDGHRQHKRFVPGRWRANGTFEYLPYPQNGGRGMMLTERWVDGKKFMEKAKTSSKIKIEGEINRFMEDLKRRVE